MIKTVQVKLTQVKVNKENPRTITGAKFNKLIDSILIFPKMMELRPIVVDDKMVALGGNMRTNALLHIANEMSGEDIAERLEGLSDFAIRTEGQRETLFGYWEDWHNAPTAYIIKASSLTEAECREFIIKDNVSFGQWDADSLSNWDTEKLDEWGLSDWEDTAIQVTPDVEPKEYSSSSASAIEEGALPPELQGINLTPADLPKLRGDDETAMGRIIICYNKGEENDVCKLVGLSSITKVVYHFSEIVQGQKS